MIRRGMWSRRSRRSMLKGSFLGGQRPDAAGSLAGVLFPKDENQGVVKRQPSAFSFVADRDRCVFAIDKPMKLSNSLLPFENTFA